MIKWIYDNFYVDKSIKCMIKCFNFEVVIHMGTKRRQTHGGNSRCFYDYPTRKNWCLTTPIDKHVPCAKSTIFISSRTHDVAWHLT